MQINYKKQDHAERCKTYFFTGINIKRQTNFPNKLNLKSSSCKESTIAKIKMAFAKHSFTKAISNSNQIIIS